MADENVSFPVTPDKVKAIIPAASASWCTKLLALPMRLAFLALDVVKFMVKPNGAVTDEFIQWLGLDVNAVTTQPQNLQATDGEWPDKITLTWNGVTSSQRYDLYRSENSTLPDNPFASSTVNSFDDKIEGNGGSAKPGVSYSYWVKAVVNGVASEPSTPDTGYAGTGGGGAGEYFLQVGPGNPLISYVITDRGTYQFFVWGGGGGGGDGWTDPGTQVSLAGAGGGSGGYVMAIFELAEGDELNLSAGLGGAHGISGNPSQVFRRPQGAALDQLITADSGKAPVIGAERNLGGKGAANNYVGGSASQNNPQAGVGGADSPLAPSTSGGVGGKLDVAYADPLNSSTAIGGRGGATPDVNGNPPIIGQAGGGGYIRVKKLP